MVVPMGDQRAERSQVCFIPMLENKALHSVGYQVTLCHGSSPSSRMSVQQKWQDIWARPKKGERKYHLAYSAETAQRLSGVAVITSFSLFCTH